jgi:hypothetical protein
LKREFGKKKKADVVDDESAWVTWESAKKFAATSATSSSSGDILTLNGLLVKSFTLFTPRSSSKPGTHP